MYKPTPREERRTRNRTAVNGLKEFLLNAAGAFCPQSWIMHTTGVSKAALSKAKRDGRLRMLSHQCQDGHVIELISLHDACRVERYRKPRGRQHRVETVFASPPIVLPPPPKPPAPKPARKRPPGRDAGIQEGRRTVTPPTASRGDKRKNTGSKAQK